jgi:hypothetical protein
VRWLVCLCVFELHSLARSFALRRAAFGGWLAELSARSREPTRLSARGDWRSVSSECQHCVEKLARLFA